jgi:PAS domain S-box-containing protein
LLSTFLLVPPDRWWRYLAVTAPIHVAVQVAATWTESFASFAAVATGVAAAAALFRRRHANPSTVASPGAVAEFLVATSLGALIPAATDAAFASGRGSAVWLDLGVCFLGNLLAGLTIAPPVVVAFTGGVANMRHWGARRWLETSGLALGLVAVSLAAFWSETRELSHFPVLLYAPFPLLLWAAVRFGLAGTCAATLVVVVLTVVSAAQGRGPFVTTSPAVDVASLQLFLLIVIVPLVLLAVLILERTRSESALRASEAKFRSLFDSNVIPINFWCADGRVSDANGAYLELTGFRPEDLAAGRVRWDEITPPDFQQLDRAAMEEARLRGACTPFEKEYVLRDGRRVPVMVGGRILPGDPEGGVGFAIDLSERKRSEAALRESEARFRAVADTAPVLIWAASVTGARTFFNRPWLDFTGRPVEQELGDGWTAGVHPDDYDSCVHLYRSAFAAREPFQMEYRLLRADGEYRWILDHGVSRTAPGGDFVGYIGSAIDITERRRLETALRESEARARAFFELTAVGATYVDVAGRLLSVNDAYCRLTGYSRSELLWRRTSELTHPDDRAATHERRRRLVAGERGPYRVEKRYVRKDGQVIWVQLDLSAVRDARGEVVHVVSLVQDITQRKLAEEALRASEERYRGVVEGQTELVCRYRPDTTLTFVNEAYCRYFGKTRDELIGTSFLTLIPEAAREKARRHVASLISAPRVVADEHQVMQPDGSIGWQRWVDHVIFDAEGRVWEFQAVGQDITERKEAEAAASAAQALLQSTIDALNAHVAILDERGFIIAVNESWRRFAAANGLGDPNHGVGRDYLAICEVGVGLAPTEASAIGQGIREVLGRKRDEFRAEYPCHTASEKRWFQMRVTCFADGGLDRLVIAHENVTEIKRAEEALQHLTARLLQSQDEERRRLARELHDGTAQNLFAMTLNIGRLQSLEVVADDKARHLIRESLGLGEQCLQDIRTLSYLLHPPLLDGAGLASALRWYVDGFVKRSGIAVDLTVPANGERMPADTERALFRIVQECLTNILRHSGSRTASIELAVAPGEARLRVRDQGTGMSADGGFTTDPEAFGVGIPGMRERLRQLGGRLEIASGADGTAVCATVPLPRTLDA